MAILSAAVEPNGWVLQVEGVWDASDFAAFDLDPNGVPKVVVASTSPGFDRIGDGAAANSGRLRGAIVGTRPLRRPYPDHALLDEVDLGGGFRRVRIALSRYIYPGDPVSVTFAAGWRSGLAGGAVAATNLSTQAVRLPSARWASPQYLTEEGPFRIDLLVANIEAEGRSAVAAVKVVGYDGTNTQEWWLTESVSDRYGDNLKCWGATINPTGLTAGVITLHWEVFPWIGAVRRSGDAHVVDPEIGFSRAADIPLQVCWDPAGTRYGGRHIYIDPVNGTTSASLVTVGATLAAAKAGTPAANNLTALYALADQSVVIPAANGYPEITTRAMDGAILTFAPGVHTVAYGSLSSVAKTVEARVTFRGDPDDVDPRNNVIFRTGTGSATFRITRVLFKDMTLELGGSWFSLGWRAHFDNVLLQGRAGDELKTVGMTSSVAAGFYRLSFTNCRYWRYGLTLSGNNAVCGLIRNTEFIRTLTGTVIVSSTRIADATVPIGSSSTVGLWSGSTDGFLWGVRNLGCDNGGLGLGVTSGAGTPASPNRYVRANVINCIFERVANGSGSAGDPFASYAGNAELVECLLEGNTFTGQRVNWAYNDPSDGLTNMVSIGNAVRNNFFERRSCKHDQFTQNGNLIAGWSNLYGVNEEANVQAHRFNWGGAEAFVREFEGMNSYKTADLASNPEAVGDYFFVDDASSASVQGSKLGFGDYRPTVGSLLLGRGQRACTDVDVLGAPRGMIFDTGAIERTGEVAAALAPGRSNHAVGGRPSSLAWRGRVLTQGARHAVGGRLPALRGEPPPGRAEALSLGRVLVVGPEGRSVRVEAD